MIRATEPAAGVADAPDRSLRGRARWALAARLARREARRHLWRQLLVVSLIFVPVLATLATFSGIDTVVAHERHRVEVATAGADADEIVRDLGRDFDEHGSLAGLDRRIHVERQWTGGDWLVARPARPGRPGSLILAPTRSVPADGRLASTVRVDRGRLPRTDREVLLTAALARRARWDVGDEVELAKGTHPLRVSGIGALREDTDLGAIVLSSTTPASYWERLAFDDVGSSTWDGWWADPGSAQEVARLWAPAGASIDALLPDERSGSVSFDRPGDVEPFVRLGIVLAATTLAALVAVVASAAFVLGARRQLRTVGLLASAGADPQAIRSMLVLQGAVPGMVAAIAAIVVGVVALAVDARIGTFAAAVHVDGSHLQFSAWGAAIATAIGIGAGATAAWMPARSTARIPVLSALAGRRPLGPVRARVPVGGLVAVGIGFGLLTTTRAVRRTDDHLLLTLTAMGGVICFVVGAVALAPALVALLGPLARRARGLRRVALRSLVRNRTQSAATVAAVAVVLAVPIALLTVLPDSSRPSVSPAAEQMARSRFQATILRSDAVDVTDPTQAQEVHPAVRRLDHQIGDLLGSDALRVEYRLATWTDGAVAVVDPDQAAKVLTPWAARQLARGRAIVDATSPTLRATTRALPAGSVAWVPRNHHPMLGDDWPSAIVSPELLDQLPGPHPLTQISYYRSRRASSAEEARARALAGADRRSAVTLERLRGEIARAGRSAPAATPSESPPAVELFVDTHPARRDWRAIGVLALVAVSTSLALLVLTITLTLRSVDGADDRRVATAVGAPPARLRRIRAFEGVILTAVGALVALPLGWLPVVAVRLGWSGDAAWAEQISGRIGPGLFSIPVLVAPVVLTGLAWWLVPAARAAVVERRPADLVTPRS